ncbi:hypothetical protein [Curtobacterium sp. MCBA15_004]|uniref:hypothetical protein n=1 Tax=Curtobacterium sp. MCBA15_004 TaxID=1898733 RepID=UPI0008DD81E2|nr:hypothetical protein [Curtobacterium sp. MCBA15_004]WIA96431.1 hypothetical protein QOL16_15235 [Curtobacterium sp. MCBA15_004]
MSTIAPAQLDAHAAKQAWTKGETERWTTDARVLLRGAAVQLAALEAAHAEYQRTSDLHELARAMNTLLGP